MLSYICVLETSTGICRIERRGPVYDPYVVLGIVMLGCNARVSVDRGIVKALSLAIRTPGHTAHPASAAVICVCVAHEMDWWGKQTEGSKGKKRLST